MATRFQVTFDAVDPDSLAQFWAQALHYILQPPPEGYDSWDAFLKAIGMDDREGTASAIVDPEGNGPRLFFQKVPEPKTAKNRVHLDLSVTSGPAANADDRRRAIDDEVRRLVALGAREIETVDRDGELWAVMNDPEGNEFCVQ